jgi:uncharacterized protein
MTTDETQAIGETLVTGETRATDETRASSGTLADANEPATGEIRATDGATGEKPTTGETLASGETLAADPTLAPGETLTIEAILDAFASATTRRALPRAALEQAVSRWHEVGPLLLAALEEAAGGGEPSEAASWILCFGIYLMTQLRETRAWRPLCALAAAGERLEAIIGDGVTEDLPLILARVYDGDPAPLRMLIEARAADPFTRDAGLNTLAWLTVAGRIDHAETARYLRDLYTTLQPQGQSPVWVGWQQAVSYLGLEDLVPQVERAFRSGWVDPMMLGLHDFRQDLRTALQATDKISVFTHYLGEESRLDDAAGYLSEWSCFQPEPPPKSRPLTMPAGLVGNDGGMGAPFRDDRWMEDPYLNDGAFRNPYRGIGRNDPCPCGSGKKFKKCCLDKARAGAGPLS